MLWKLLMVILMTKGNLSLDTRHNSSIRENNVLLVLKLRPGVSVEGFRKYGFHADCHIDLSPG